MSEEYLSPHSCSRCKHSHRRCDRIFPTCSECKHKNKPCSYTELPKKPGPKRYKPYDTKTASTKSQDIPEPMEKYFEVICFGTPIFDRNKLMSTIEYKKILKERTMQIINSPASNEELLLLYAMQAVFFKKSQLGSLAENSIRQAKQLLRESFDQVLRSYNTACAYMFLGICSLFDNDVDRAKFYLQNTKEYINRWRETTSQEKIESAEDKLTDVRMRFLEMFVKNYTDDTNMDMVVRFKAVLYMYFMMREFNELEQTALEFSSFEVQFGPIATEIRPFIDQIRQDIEDHTNEHYKLDIAKINYFVDTFEQIPQIPEGIEDVRCSATKRLSTLMYAQGAKLQLLQQIGHFTSKEIRTVADSITAYSLTTNLSIVHMGFTGPILLSMQVHMNSMANTVDMYDQDYLLAAIKMDVKALQGIMVVDKRVKAEIGQLVDDVVQNIKEQDERRTKSLIDYSLKMASNYTEHISANQDDFLPETIRAVPNYFGEIFDEVNNFM